MATVYLGRAVGEAGFARLVAVKRLHTHLAAHRDLRVMMVEEARLASRVHHAHVVDILDVVDTGEELLLVMEYVAGVSLSTLLNTLVSRGQAVPPPILVAVMAEVLEGLHAAHEARNESGELLGLVHRDVSPQNILVGTDGIARLIDFGIAKASGQFLLTQNGAIKGKVGYLAPELMVGAVANRRTDVYAAGVVLWECAVGDRLYSATMDEDIAATMAHSTPTLPSRRRPELPVELDATVLCALAAHPSRRFASAAEFAERLRAIVKPASQEEVAAWCMSLAGAELHERAALVSALERRAGMTPSARFRVFHEVLSSVRTPGPRIATAVPPAKPLRIPRRKLPPIASIALVVALLFLAGIAGVVGRC
jgi:serine/threonine-protein kinase